MMEVQAVIKLAQINVVSIMRSAVLSILIATIVLFTGCSESSKYSSFLGAISSCSYTDISGINDVDNLILKTPSDRLKLYQDNINKLTEIANSIKNKGIRDSAFDIINNRKHILGDINECHDNKSYINTVDTDNMSGWQKYNYVVADRKCLIFKKHV